MKMIARCRLKRINGNIIWRFIGIHSDVNISKSRLEEDKSSAGRSQSGQKIEEVQFIPVDMKWKKRGKPVINM